MYAKSMRYGHACCWNRITGRCQAHGTVSHMLVMGRLRSFFGVVLQRQSIQNSRVLPSRESLQIRRLISTGGLIAKSSSW